LPLDLFTSGEARWLGVRINGGEEQPRVLLLSVPYALKAADAETIGGLPASAFVLAAPVPGSATASAETSAESPAAAPPASSNVTTTGGTVNVLPLWTTATNIQSSAIAQTGTGMTAKIGIGTTTPAVTLDVKGAETLRGLLTLSTNGVATATKGANSQPQDLVASSFSSSTSTAVNQTFQWQAEPAANNTANPSGTLNLLYGLGGTAPSETGLRIAANGQINFAKGQTFPGTGSVTSVGLSAPSSDFTVSGSPVTKSGTLNLKWSVAPTNASTANAIVKRDSTGSFSAGSITASSVGATNPSGAAINGTSTGTSAGSDGVDGVTTSATASGVAGINNSGGIGVYATGGTGVYASSAGGAGVGAFGQTYTESATGQRYNGSNVGVWGDAGNATAPAYGVLGTADQNTAGLFISNSPETFSLVVQNFSGPPLLAWVYRRALRTVYAVTSHRVIIIRGNGRSCRNGNIIGLDRPEKCKTNQSDPRRERLGNCCDRRASCVGHTVPNQAFTSPQFRLCSELRLGVSQWSSPTCLRG
jgi:hypothetical protein